MHIRPPPPDAGDRRQDAGTDDDAPRSASTDAPVPGIDADTPLPAWDPVLLNRAELRRRLTAFRENRDTPPRVRGDFDLNPDLQTPSPLRPAAVLVPLVEHDDHWSVLLTQRTVHLSAHAGQISFPGGGHEPADSNGIDTALRETREEINLPADRIEVLGRLDTYLTRTGFQIEPVVGAIRGPAPVKADPFEVADIFEVPLSFVLSDRMPKIHSRTVNERERRYFVFPHGKRYIWGATAGMLVNLREVLTGRR